MKTYLVAYDSILPELSLIDKIKSFQLWARPLTNVWLIKTDSDRGSVMNYVTSGSFFVGKILIIEVTNDWISRNLSQEVVNWMQGGA